MSKKTFYKLMSSSLLCSLFFASPVYLPATEKEVQGAVEVSTKEEPTLDLSKISEAFGHLIGKNLESLGFDFEMDKIIKGIQDCVAGKESPMSESECVQAISQDQEKKFKSLAEDNLKLAEGFLKENAAKDGIVTLDENKLQYKIEKEGTGEVVEPHYVPLLRYKGSFLDGKVFGASKEEESISLDETIPGFSKGIVGMKEGEKRTLFIHPDFGYGVNGYLPPNSLLTFEIEIVKANQPQHIEDGAISSSEELEDSAEFSAEEDEESVQ